MSSALSDKKLDKYCKKYLLLFGFVVILKWKSNNMLFFEILLFTAVYLGHNKISGKT